MIAESQIRQRAYELWEKDARPEGAEEFYWRLAQDQLATERRAVGADLSDSASGEWNTDLHYPEPTGERSAADSEWPAKGEATRYDGT